MNVRANQNIANPYIGPRPFTRHQMQLFFGRDHEISNIVTLIMAYQAVLLYAASGAGKSSLINAAIIPELERQNFQILPPARAGISTGRTHKGINFYVNNILNIWREDLLPNEKSSFTTLAEALHLISRPRDSYGAPVQRLIVLDQFEEFFTSREKWQARKPFFEEVTQALADDPLLTILFSMREDFIAQMDPYLEYLPDRLNQRFRMERLRRNQALAAVTQPLIHTERRFEEGVAEQFIDDLMQIRVQDLSGQTQVLQGEFVEPVQLQVASEGFWQELPSDIRMISTHHLQTYGDIDKALLDLYERCLQVAIRRTNVKEDTLRDWFENVLLTPAGTRNTVYRGNETTGGLPNQTIDELENLYIIRAERREGARWYELAHDRFIEPIQTSNRQRQQQLAERYQSLPARLWRFFTYSFGAATIIALVAIIVFMVAAFSWYTNIVAPYRDEIAALVNYQPDFQIARVIDASGEQIMTLTSQAGAREAISINEVSPYFIHALVSFEEPTFYESPGLNLFSVVDTYIQTLRNDNGEIEAGAATITRQIANNLVLTDRSQAGMLPTTTRRAVTLAIANTYSKNELLEIYMNELPFGNQTFGVEAAAQFYFDKTAADLNMAESALLTGILPQPSSSNPIVDREAAFEAMNTVIERMIDVECLNFQHGEWAGREAFCVNEATLYNGQPLFELDDSEIGEGYTGQLQIQTSLVKIQDYQPSDAEFLYPHFSNFIVERVESVFGPNALYQRGFTIHTTLMPDLQEYAELELRNGISAFSLNGVNTGAVVVLDPTTGAIRALVGSPDFSDVETSGQIDNTRTWQQPGNAIMPIVYTAALSGTDDNYLTPASILWDVPSNYSLAGGGTYRPANFDGRYRGPVSVRNALAQSLNIPAVKAYEFIGPNLFVDTSLSLGLNFLEGTTFGLPSALGASEVRLLDITQSYGTLAADGIFREAYAITHITENINGQEVEIDLSDTGLGPQFGFPAIEPEIAYLMQNILSDDNARAPQFGQGGMLSGASFDLPNLNYVAAKSGTSNPARDLWTIGFTNNWVVGVWVGTIDNSETTGNLTGARVAAPIWNGIMREALRRTGGNPGVFAPPPGIVEETVCNLTGALADNPDDCPTERIVERFASDHLPPEEGFVEIIPVDSWTGLRANEWCSEYVVNQAFSDIDDKFARNWLQTTPQGQQILDFFGLSGGLQPVPTGSCQQGQPIPSVDLNFPQEGSTVTETETITITGQISAIDLQRWVVEFAPVGTEQWTTIGTGQQQFPQAGSALVGWDTTQVPNNSYRVRLAAYSQSGGYIFREAVVEVQNDASTSRVTPTQLPASSTPFEVRETPTPLPTSTVTPTSLATATPFGTNRTLEPTETEVQNLDIEPFELTATALIRRATSTAQAASTPTPRE